jgi:hypothetical protein
MTFLSHAKANCAGRHSVDDEQPRTCWTRSEEPRHRGGRRTSRGDSPCNKPFDHLHCGAIDSAVIRRGPFVDDSLQAKRWERRCSREDSHRVKAFTHSRTGSTHDGVARSNRDKDARTAHSSHRWVIGSPGGSGSDICRNFRPTWIQAARHRCDTVEGRCRTAVAAHEDPRTAVPVIRRRGSTATTCCRHAADQRNDPQVSIDHTSIISALPSSPH